MSNIAFIGVCVCFAASFWVSLLFNLHMFQLNGYKSLEHLKWIGKNWRKFTPHLMFLVIGAALLMLKPGTLVFATVSALFVAFGAYYLPRKAKKPLVITPRVKRMIATTLAVLLVVIGVVARFSTAGILAALLAEIYALLPFVMLLANFLNTPIERAVNRHYINDAKKILASARNLTIIGITGSYGKTSVKYYLNTLLRAKFNVLMTPESFNTPMGIVKTIRGELKATHEIFICEMGARYVREIKEICDIVHPKHGIITSIGPQHLETFRSLENISKTKFELADSLPEGGMLFLNGDNDIVRRDNKNPDAVFYGLGEHNDYRALDLRVSEKGTEFAVIAPDGETCRFTTRLIGKHNVINILGAIAASHRLGIPLGSLTAQVRRLESVPHRLQLNVSGSTVIIDDAYNSNPNGTKVALETLSYFDGTRIIVTPGMVELGESQDRYNFEFGKDIAAVCDFAVLVGEKQTESILRGLLDAGYPEEKIFVAKGIDEALQKANAVHAPERRIILLENDLPDNY